MQDNENPCQEIFEAYNFSVEPYDGGCTVVMMITVVMTMILLLIVMMGVMTRMRDKPPNI